MKALCIYAGPVARKYVQERGLQARDVRVIPAAAGGPKGLILGPLDRYLFGNWLLQSSQPIDLVGASIGAWRMATACLNDPVAAFNRLEHDYIHQDYAVKPGHRFPTSSEISKQFGESLARFFAGQVGHALHHPRYRLHIVTSRGRHMLRREHKLATPLGYASAFLTNMLHRKAMGAWLERVVFSSPHRGLRHQQFDETMPALLPFSTQDYRTRHIALTGANFSPALQASCSIPFVLQAVHNIPGAPKGAYWDGGITDYHLHLNYSQTDGIVLYPHFQKNIVPGWLDKSLKWRHGASRFLDRMVVLAPNPQWIATLPRAKLPDRQDFAHHGTNLASRIAQWTACTSAAQQLADEFAQWTERPNFDELLDL